MPTYLTPGVYVHEVRSSPGAIEGVGTSTAAFVGKTPLSVAEDLNVPIAVNNWSEFRTRFVGEGGTHNDFSTAVYGFFDNGGSRCYIVNVGDGEITGPRQGLEALEAIDEVAIVAAPGRTDAESHEALISHCEKMHDRVACLDGPADWDDATTLTERKRAPSSKAKTKAAAADASAGFQRPRASSYAAMYVPHLEVANLSGPGRVTIGPSGHMAGLWAHTDATRGVHKAAANVALRGVLDLSRHITKEEQGALNPFGVNAIRSFRTGIKPWGARTLADATESEYRYLPVRRSITAIAESVEEGTTWVVFEPNDALLHANIRAQVSAYLRRVWRSGALAGASAEEAFFVKCDAETNPPEAVDAGEVRCLIGLAPVKPAEFVIFEITQSRDSGESAA